LEFIFTIGSRIINNSYHSAIGTTPARVFFGDSIHLNRGLLVHKVEEKPDQVVIEDYIQQLNVQLSNIVNASQKFQQRVLKQRLAKSPDNPTEFLERQYVLAKYHVRPPNKTSFRWRGPFIIISRMNNIYHCQDLITLQIYPFFIDQLKAFNLSENMDFQSCKDIAMRDRDEFIVESIIDYRHRGNIKRRKELEFRVRWLGYAPEEDTWLPYKEVKDLEALDVFIAANPDLRFLHT